MTSRRLDGQAYLDTNYLGYEHHPEFNAEYAFMIEATKQIRRDARVLDLGSGPTIYQVVHVARTAASIILSDVSPELLGFSERWRDRRQGAYNWDPYIGKALELEESIGIRSGDCVASRKKKIREAIDFAIIDIQKPQQWTFAHPFDLVQNCFVGSSAATSDANFLEIWKKCVRFAAPGGDLLFAEVCDAAHYCVGDSKVYAHKISYETQIHLLNALGCTVVAKEFIPADEGQPFGYSGLAMFHLRKPPA